MRDNNIKPAEAASILGVSPQFVRVAMQQGKLNIGIAIQLFEAYTAAAVRKGKDSLTLHGYGSRKGIKK